MQWEQAAYREVVQGYSKRDACLAILIFSVQMGILFGQGWLYTTDLPLLLMASLNLITALVNMGMALGVVWLSGQRELGLHRQCLGKSMAMGILLATVLLASLLAVQMGIYHHTLHVKPLSWLSVVIFTVGVFNEEFFFRGILQTRLRGLLPWGWVCSVVTAGLFLLSHYPVYWGVGESVGFSNIAPVHAIYILLLHFFCSSVYRRTNCLWGAMALHLVYNMGTAMMGFA